MEQDPIINPGEMTRVVHAFLSNPVRGEKGATSEELLTVLRWAEDLKIKAAINIAILKQVYKGALHLDLKDNDVVMSINNNYEEVPDPEVDKWLEM